ncbi:hypothetical protein [Novosphingobium sp. BL-52-GroH]|uniref:hypothetical protein n=1 Tax=Novosphingobium sp. BL-52-GroH TaxID=3349877 RepID=UPI00384BB09A
MPGLAGNLEEGLRDDADQSRRITLALPQSWRGSIWTDRWTGTAIAAPQGGILLDSK